MSGSSIPAILARGVETASRGEYESALTIFSAVYQNVPPETQPSGLSSYGLCLSKIAHKNKLGAELCEKAIKLEPYNALHWTNLVRLYLGVKNRKKAVETLERGMKKLPYDDAILRTRDEIGYRKAPYFRFLRRQHPLNKLYSRSATTAKRHAKPILFTLGGAVYIAIMVGVFRLVFN